MSTDTVPLIHTDGIRTACVFCTCGYSQIPGLFPNLTKEKVRIALKDLSNQESLNRYLIESRIHIKKDTSNIVFPEGVCQSVRTMLLNKIEQLGVEIDDITGLGFVGWKWEEELEIIE